MVEQPVNSYRNVSRDPVQSKQRCRGVHRFVRCVIYLHVLGAVLCGLFSYLDQHRGLGRLPQPLVGILFLLIATPITLLCRLSATFGTRRRNHFIADRRRLDDRDCRDPPDRERRFVLAWPLVVCVHRRRHRGCRGIWCEPAIGRLETLASMSATAALPLTTIGHAPGLCRRRAGVELGRNDAEGSGWASATRTFDGRSGAC